MEATKKDLGGGNSNILFVHPEPWGFMIQFDEHIFQMGWLKLTTNKKRSMFCWFYWPFFLVPQKTEPWREGEICCPPAPLDYTTPKPAHLGGKLQLDRGNAGENSWRQPGRGGCFEGSLLEVAVGGNGGLFVQICPSKLRTHKSWKKLF